MQFRKDEHVDIRFESFFSVNIKDHIVVFARAPILDCLYLVFIQMPCNAAEEARFLLQTGEISVGEYIGTPASRCLDIPRRNN